MSSGCTPVSSVPWIVYVDIILRPSIMSMSMVMSSATKNRVGLRGYGERLKQKGSLNREWRRRKNGQLTTVATCAIETLL